MNCEKCQLQARMTNKKKSGGTRWKCFHCGHRFSVGMMARGRPMSRRRGIKCPICVSSYVRLRKDGTNHCNTCEHDFPDAEQWKPPQVKVKAKGSGVIAGRVEIGRGANWKAGC